jgi:hypothetical protein
MSNDIFNLDSTSYTDSVTTSSDVQGNPDYYKPSLDNPNVKDNIYDSLIRFVPNVHNPNLLAVSKFGYYFNETPNGSAAWIDCTSNEPNSKTPNIITQAFFYLRKHESVALKSLARNFSRKHYFWMLVQIIKDAQQPELENTVKIMRYGKQVRNLHDKELEDKSEYGKPPCVFYHPYLGKDFNLVINKKQVDFKGDGNLRTITNYDESSFMGVSPIKIDGQPIQDSEEDRKKLVEWLKANSPDLSQESYVPWDQDTEDLAVNIVRTIIDDDVVFNKIWNITYKDSKKKMPVAAKSESNNAATGNQKVENVKSSITKDTTAGAETKSQEPDMSDEDDMGNGGISLSDVNFDEV